MTERLLPRFSPKIMYRCPECGANNLEVVVEVWATLIQTDANFETDTSTPKNADHEWGDNSVMRCTDCNCQEIVERFAIAERFAVSKQEAA